MRFLSLVIAGLDPAIHAAIQRANTPTDARGDSAWTTGSSPVVTREVGEALRQAPLPPRYARPPFPLSRGGMIHHSFNNLCAFPESILALSASESGTVSIHSIAGGFITNGQSTANRI
jgi:hypothetical protein